MNPGLSFNSDSQAGPHWQQSSVASSLNWANRRTYYLYDDTGACGNIPVGEYNAAGIETAVNVVGPDGWRERVVPGWTPDQYGDYYPYTSHFSDDYFAFDPQGSVAERLRIDGSEYSSPPSQGAGDLIPYLYDEQAYDAWGNRLFDYDPFGTSESAPGAQQTTQADVAGYEAQYGYQTDPSTGLVLAGHRFYQPQKLHNACGNQASERESIVQTIHVGIRTQKLLALR